MKTGTINSEDRKFNIIIKPIRISEEERKKRRERILKALLEENNA